MKPGLWTDIYNVFNPFQPIPPERVADWYVERPHTPRPALMSRLDPTKVPQRVLLVGERSSGKSTELTKLAAELAGKYDALIVRLDLTQNTDIDRANPVDIIYLMGAAIFKVAQEELPHKPDRGRFDALTQSLYTLVREHTENKKFEVDTEDLLRNLVVAGATVVFGPAGTVVTERVTRVIPFPRFTFGTDDKVVRRLEVEPKIKEMLKRLNDIIDDVQAKAGQRPLVLLVDGLDWQPPAMTALNFAETTFLAEPACRVIYTTPMVVRYGVPFAGVIRYFQSVQFPNVRLYEKDRPDVIDREGYRMLRAVVQCRLQWLGLKPAEVVTAGALDSLIKASGGLMRDLIRLMQDAAVKAEVVGKERISKAIADDAANELRRWYAGRLTATYRKELVRIHKSHELSGSAEGDDLLRVNMILGYLNKDTWWFDAHPILWPLLETEG